MQQSPEEETPFVYVTLATLVTLATAGYTPCLFGYVTIGLARHNRTHFSQSERLLVKPKRPCTDLCAEQEGVWNRLQSALIRCHASLGTMRYVIRRTLPHEMYEIKSNYTNIDYKLTQVDTIRCEVFLQEHKNFIHVIYRSDFDVKYSLNKPPFKLMHGWVITSHAKHRE